MKTTKALLPQMANSDAKAHASVQPVPMSAQATVIRIPADWEPHDCCWMAWAVDSDWGGWVNAVQDELATVIGAVAQSETVCLLTPKSALSEATARFRGLNVKIIEAPVDDIWMRDIAPTFAERGDDVVAIDWNFNGWDRTRRRRPRPGDRIVELSESLFGVEQIRASFVAEGGALISDGAGTVVTTRSCLLHPSRLPPVGLNARTAIPAIERGFKAFGVERVIWLNGDPHEPITNGHVDGYVLWAGPTTVLVESSEDGHSAEAKIREEDIKTLAKLQRGSQSLNVLHVSAPRYLYWRFRGPLWAPCYLNAYIANGSVITARFGDEERDREARRMLQRAFPDRSIVMLSINHICSGGGGVRCLCQPMPARRQQSWLTTALKAS